MPNERTFFTPPDAPPDQLFAVAAFYEEIHDDGVDVDRVELTELGNIELEYTLCDRGESDFREYHDRVSDELTCIGDSYDLAQKYADLGDLNAIATADGEALSWYVESEWVEKHRNGEMESQTLSENVQDTIAEVG